MSPLGRILVGGSQASLDERQPFLLKFLVATPVAEATHLVRVHCLVRRSSKLRRDGTVEPQIILGLQLGSPRRDYYALKHSVLRGLLLWVECSKQGGRKMLVVGPLRIEYFYFFDGAA